MFLSVCILLCATRIQETPTPTPLQAQTEPARPAWMAADRALQVPVTLDAKGRSLRLVLAALSRQSGVSMQAEADIREYRVALHLEAQPLWKLMGRLEDLFGHGRLPSRACVWQRGEETGKPPHYFFARTPKGREEEAELRDWPLHAALRRLRERRDYARLAPQQRSRFQTDDPAMQDTVKQGKPLADDQEGLIYQALAALTDDQLKTLAEEGTVEAPQVTVSPEAAAWLLKKVPHDNSPLADNQDTRPPSGAVFTFGKETDWKGMYALHLGFHSGYPRYVPYGSSFDTLNNFEPLENIDAESAQESGPVLDLLADEKVPGGKQPFASLPTVLNVLARKAHINLYAETFAHPQRVLRFTKGTLTFLLAHLCSDFGCKWLKVGSDYLVYSKSWAQDRDGDVSQPDLEAWLAKRAKQGRYELKDYVEMAHLRDAQVETLQNVLGIIGPFGAGNQHALRLLNALGSNNLTAAYGENGTLLPPDTLLLFGQELKAVFERRSITPPIRVKLEALPTGVSIKFADRQGKSREFWANQGNQEQGGALAPASALRAPPHSQLQPDGSYLPPWLAGQ